MREEGGGSRRGRQLEAARGAEESALTYVRRRSKEPPTGSVLLPDAACADTALVMAFTLNNAGAE